MVVCKFFQQGSCRYGQNCRFDHIYGSKYSYNANATSEATSASPAVTDDQLVNQVHTDLQSMIRGGQWLLSGYAPFKEKPTFPGLVDMSPEEARLFIYEAKANNSLDQAVAFLNNLFQEAKQKYELLLTKNSNITKVLRSLYNGENVPAPFGNLPQANSSAFGNASSVFSSAVQPTPHASVFSQNNTPSVFAQNNAFPSADPAKSIFAQATQNTFQNQNPSQAPSIFGPGPTPSQSSMFVQPDTTASIFAQAASTAQSIFATQNALAQNAQPTQNVFNAQNTAAGIFANASQSVFAPSQQPPFHQPPGDNHLGNVFQKTVNQSQSAFGGQNVFQQAVVDTRIYSNIEDISAEDMEAFNAEEFKMGFIPEIPPPQSLCI